MATKAKGVPMDYLDTVATERKQQHAPATPTKAARPAKVTASPPVKSKATFYLSDALVSELRGLAQHVAPVALGGSISELVEQAITEKLVKLRKQHNEGKPFPAETVGRRGRPAGRR